MNTLNTKREEMFIRVREFGAQFDSAFPENSFGAVHFALLDQIITQLRAQALEQSQGRNAAHESFLSKSATGADLRRRMDAIGRTGRVMAQTLPVLEDKFRLPRSEGDQELLNAARTFAADAEPFKAEFVKRGFNADFINDLLSVADEFDAAINQKAHRTRRHVAATAGIDEVIGRGLHVVGELDALVRNIFAGDASALAAWESASHVERLPRKPRQGTNGTPAPAPAQG